MLDAETKRRIDTARDILVGKVPDPKSQVEQITIALIYKFMDDMDAEAEELGGKRTFFNGEFARYGWANLMDVSLGGQETLNRYAEGIEKMNQNQNVPQLFRDIFKNAFLPYRDPETLKLFLKTINEFKYDHSERLGDAFEYLLSVMSSQGDAGQFRTPRHIIDFMVALVDPQKEDSILDPACGTAGFLISAYKHIMKANSENDNGKGGMTPEERTRLMRNIEGYDISPDMVRLSLVNLYLHGFATPKIYEYDTLTDEERWNDFADVILANPPFMSPKGGIRPHKRFSVESNRSEVLFVDYIMEHLTPNGRAAVIVPEGIIFQGGKAYKALRKMLVENDYLVGVISLPAGVFNPYSGVKTSILWIDRALAKKSDSILFCRVEHDGYDLGAQRRANGKDDLPMILAELINSKNETFNSKLSRMAIINKCKVIQKAEIDELRSYNLTADRYFINNFAKSQTYPLVKLGEVILDIKDGGTPSRRKAEYFGGEINWCVVKDITPEIHNTQEKLTDLGLQNCSAKIWPIDSIIISLGASIGHVGIAKVPTATKQGLSGIIVDKEKIFPKYLYYILSTQVERISSFATGVTIKEVRPTALKELFKFPLPPLEKQEEIILELDEYQRIIDGARMEIVKNEEKIKERIRRVWGE